MYKVISACLLAFCSTIASLLPAQPLVQTAGPGGGTLFCLEEVGSDLWVGTPNGIYVSSDNAATWTPLPMDSALYVMDLLAFGDTVLMSARGIQAPGPGTGTGQGVWRSTDKGITWQKTLHIPSEAQVILTFRRSQGVIVLGVEQGWPMISYNSGQTWQNHVSPYDANYGNSFAYSSDSLVTLLWNDTYFQYMSVSRDGFATWQKVDSLPMSQAYRGIQYLDSVVCILVMDTTGGAGGTTFRRSRDYARTWDTLSTPLAFGALMQEYQSDTVFAYEGNTQTVMYSVDRCASWQVSPNQNVEFNDYLGWDNVVVRQQQRFFIPPAYFNLNPYYLFGREVEVTDLLTKQVTHSTQGINATRCYGLTTADGTLYVGELINQYIDYGVNLFHSEDGASSWQNYPDVDGSIPLPFHIREVPGKPDSLACWGDMGLALYRKSQQQTYLEFGSGFLEGPDQVADYQHSVLYADYTTLYAFDLDAWMEETIPLPLPQTNVIYKVTSFQDSLVYVLFDEGVISGNPATATWTVTPLPQFTFYPPYESDFNYRMPTLPTFLQPNDSAMALVGADVPLVITHDGGQTWITKACAGLPFNAAANSPHLPIMSVVWQGQWLGYVPEYGLYLSADEGDSWQFFRKLPFQCTGMKLMGNLVYFSSRNAGVWRLGGSPNLLTGKVFLDQNNNQTQDAGEQALKNMKIAADAAGNVTNSLPDGTYALLALLPGDSARLRTPLYTTAAPAKIALTGQNQAQDWAVQFTQTVPDLTGDATAATVFRPGFTTPVALTCRNVGAIAQTATVSLQLDPYVSYVSASPAPTVSGNTLTWTTPTLGYLDDFQVNVMLSTPIIVPPTQDSVLLSWAITSAATDAAPANNTGLLHVPIRTSYDPNDKSCNFGSTLPLQAGDSTEALVYTIRFQNMGTYQADKVVVADTLDPDLDPASLEVIASSHAMRLEQNTEHLQFIFDPIVLPAAQDNEPGSHGFVKYSVRLREQMPPGTEVENTAYIYFDFNPAIVTNTVTTRLTTGLIPSPGALLAAWQVYPNPANETLFVRPGQPVPAGCVLYVFDLQGNQLRQQPLPTVGATALDMRGLAAGWYFCRIADAQGRTLATGKVEVE